MQQENIPIIAIVENAEKNAVANSSVATDEFQCAVNHIKTNSTVITAEMQKLEFIQKE